MADVTICIPSIPPRINLRERAIRSIGNQLVSVKAVAVAMDLDHNGAWATRNEALRMARTEWVGFLDDDDELMENHVKRLLEVADMHGADMVWGWFETNGNDPWPHYRGRQYDIAQPHVIPITYMVKRELIMEAMEEMGGFQGDVYGAWDLQDMPVINEMIRLGGKLHADDHTTWFWNHHGDGSPGVSGNTSGLPGRW